METSFQELKKKETVNVCDGKRLGKVTDVVFSYPEGRVLGIVVPGSKGLRWGKADLFIALNCVEKIGVDVVLVELRSPPKPEKKQQGKWSPPEPPPPRTDRRDYGEYE